MTFHHIHRRRASSFELLNTHSYIAHLTDQCENTYSPVHEPFSGDAFNFARSICFKCRRSQYFEAIVNVEINICEFVFPNSTKSIESKGKNEK